MPYIKKPNIFECDDLDVTADPMIQGYMKVPNYYNFAYTCPGYSESVHMWTEVWYYATDNRIMIRIGNRKNGYQYVPFFDGKFPDTVKEFADAVEKHTVLKFDLSEANVHIFPDMVKQAKAYIADATMDVPSMYPDFNFDWVHPGLKKEEEKVEEKKEVYGVMSIVADGSKYETNVVVKVEKFLDNEVSFSFNWKDTVPNDKKRSEAHSLRQNATVCYDCNYADFCKKVANHAFLSLGAGNAQEYYRMLHDLGVREYTREEKWAGLDKKPSPLYIGEFECSAVAVDNFHLPFAVFRDNDETKITVYGNKYLHIRNRTIVFGENIRYLSINLDRIRQAVDTIPVTDRAYMLTNSDYNGEELKRAQDAIAKHRAEKAEKEKDMTTVELSEIKMIHKKCADERVTSYLPGTRLVRVDKISSYLNDYERLRVTCPHCGSSYEVLVKSSAYARLTPRDIQGKIYMASNGEIVPTDFYKPERVKVKTVGYAVNVPTQLKDLDLDKEIKEIIFNDPATVIKWKDGSESIVQARDGEKFDPEKGLAMAISKRVLGNDHDYYITFLKALKKYQKNEKKKAEAKTKKDTVKKSTKKKESSKKEA